MQMARSRIAEAYVQIVPVTGGLEKSIAAQMAGAGTAGGVAFGGNLMGSLKKVMGPLVAVLGAGALAGFFKSGVDGANALQGSLREVVTLTGLSGDAADTAFSEFQDGVKGVSAELGIAQDILTGGLYQALSAGVPRENAFTFLEVAGRAAIAGVTDTETAVDGLTTVINAFGLDASQASAVSDSLFTAVKGGKTTFEELSASLFNVAPAAAAANVSMEEVNAAIAALTASGTPTSVATTQIRAALVGLQRPSEDLDKIFQALGYDSAQLAIESEGLQFALDAVKEASGGSNGQLQKLLGSVEAVAAVNVLAGTGAAKFTAELEAQANATGASQAAFDEIDKSRSVQRLRVSFENMKLQLSDGLVPVMNNMADFIVDTAIPGFFSFLDAVKEAWGWVRDNSTWIAPITIGLTTLIAGIATAGVVGQVAAIGTGSFFRGLMIGAGQLKIVTAAQWLWNAAMTANPIGIIILAIAALVGALVYFFTQTELGKATWDAIMEGIGAAFTWLNEMVIQPVVGWIVEAWNTLIGAIQTAWNDYIKPVLDAIGMAFQFLWDYFISPVIQFITFGFVLIAVALDLLWKHVVKPIFEFIGKIFQWLWNYVVKPIINFIVGAFKVLGAIFTWLYENIAKPIFDGIGMAFRWLWEKVLKPVIDFVIGAFERVGEVTGTIFGGIKDFIVGTFERIVQLIKVPINGIIRFINVIIDALNAIKIDIPDWVPEFGGRQFGFNLKRIPQLAEGGVIRSAGAVMVGEEGPEILTLNRGAKVTPLDRATGGSTVVYNAAPNYSLTAEEQLFQAMRRARVVASW
jgi:TP901 family phage tail tape measure protein